MKWKEQYLLGKEIRSLRNTKGWKLKDNRTYFLRSIIILFFMPQKNKNKKGEENDTKRPPSNLPIIYFFGFLFTVFTERRVYDRDYNSSASGFTSTLKCITS